MKRILACILIAAFLTGCMHSTRLSRRAVVQVVGLDWRQGEYVATVQLYGLPNGEAKKAEIITANGKTLTALFEEAAIRQGKQLFLGNLRMIVIGSSLAEKGIGDIIPFLNGYHQLSPATQVAIALGEASAMLEAKSDRTPSSGELLDTLSAAQKTGYAPECRLMDLIPAGLDQAIPILALEETKKNASSENAASQTSSSEDSKDPSAASGSGGAEKNQDQENPEPVLAGSAILSNGRAAAYLTPEMTRGLCWMEGKLSTAVLETQNPLSAAITRKASRRISPEVLADNVVFTVSLDVRSTLLEAPPNPEIYPDIAREQEHVIRSEVEQFIAISARQGLDPLHLTALLQQRFPSLSGKSDPRKLLAGAGFDIRVACEVDRKGAASPER